MLPFINLILRKSREYFPALFIKIWQILFDNIVEATFR